MSNHDIFIVIANWKMNFSLQESEDFLSKLSNSCQYDHIIFAPLIPYLLYLSRKFLNFQFATQDLSALTAKSGAYTGEYSAHLLSQSGINYALIGHSERRFKIKESDAMIIQKLLNAITSNMTPIICLSDPIHIREQKTYISYIINQINGFLQNPLVLQFAQKHMVLIAYEPYHSIGNNKLLLIEELKEDLMIIHSYLKSKKINFKLIYGGSVNDKNIEALQKIKVLNGILIGNSSLKLEELISILALCQNSMDAVHRV